VSGQRKNCQQRGGSYGGLRFWRIGGEIMEGVIGVQRWCKEGWQGGEEEIMGLRRE